jgi:hypothetical protein
MLTFKASYGSTINLHREGEIEGIEFLQPPIEYRFLRKGVPISDWALPAIGYVSLLHPLILDGELRTRGLDARHLAVETRGLRGSFILLVWPRT